MTKKESITVVTGDFDPITYNQFQILKNCKTKCDWLIVGVHSDVFMEIYRGVQTYTYEQRMEMIESLPFVDEVFTFNDMDGTSCNLLKLIKMCYPQSNITYVSYTDNIKELPESKIRGIKFETIK
jgi:cytidyltransferase-like protein